MFSKRQINNISDIFLIPIVLIFLFLLFGELKTVNGQNNSFSGFSTVIIDAGHGGKDPGAVVGKAREKEIVLDIALRLGRLVKKGLPDVKVIYTRDADFFVPLFKRSVIANNSNADLFISIHANYCESSSVKGTETYVLGLHRNQDNFEVAKKENSVILLEEDYSKRYEGFDPNSTESYIAFELIHDNHIEQSVIFAGMIQDLFRQHAGRPDRDVRQAGFLVLRETAMPSVLIETGYLSNKAEAAYLMTSDGRETIANSIFNSLKNYKAKYDQRLNLASTASREQPEIQKETKDFSARDSDKVKKESITNSEPVTGSDAKGNKKSIKSIPQKNSGIKEVVLTNSKKTVESSSILATSIPVKVSENAKSDKKKSFKGKKISLQDKDDSLLNYRSSGSSISEENKIAVKTKKTVISAEKEPENDNQVANKDQNRYGIQIAASKVKLPKTFSLFKGIRDLREIEIGGYYKYYCFTSDSRSKINENLSKIRQRIPDAFLVIFKDGKPFPLKDVQKR